MSVKFFITSAYRNNQKFQIYLMELLWYHAAISRRTVPFASAQSVVRCAPFTSLRARAQTPFSPTHTRGVASDVTVKPSREGRKHGRQS
ncbi:hypothetical protein RHIZ404_200348 [Rhizobium sp. EC-SD404]|nr:hypothetical protein RHIZ404_200348 [Rhizobium sp. EC-SD404]